MSDTPAIASIDKDQIDEILLFWFGSPEESAFGTPKLFWFSSTPQDDRLIKQRFEAVYEKAKEGKLDHWLEESKGTLVLILLMDQIPRHIFRGKPRAFATDALALAFAKIALEKKYDQTLSPIYRRFFYMPFMHAEDLDAQKQSLQLFNQLPDVKTIAFAQAHYDIISRFKRFPHRNAILGRLSTPEEIAFLRRPNTSF
ncbi:MAG: DUF924 family protein [Alphaproteobacteria bacterium]